MYKNSTHELALEDSEAYRPWMHMDTSSFEELLALVKILQEPLCVNTVIKSLSCCVVNVGIFLHLARTFQMDVIVL